MIDTTSWSRTAEWPGEPLSVAAARRFVSEHLAGPELAGLLDDVLVVVSELVSNVVLHARTPAVVTVGQLRGSPFVSVRDTSSRPLYAQRLPISATHGRGLHVVAACSSSWGVTQEPDGGKSVWATFEAAQLASVLPR